METEKRLWASLSEAAYVADMQDIPPGASPVRVIREEEFLRALKLYAGTMEDVLEKERARIREKLGL